MFSAGPAAAADYKIDKEGQHAFVNFRIQHLGYSWLYGTFKDSLTVLLPLTKKIRLPIK